MTTSTRTYVLDTSVLLSSPRAMFSFKEHEVVLPLVVINELEAKRNDPELGKVARAALRALDAAFVNIKDAEKGVVVTPEGGRLRVEVNHVESETLPKTFTKDYSHDTRIIIIAHNLMVEAKTKGREVILVSKDLPMRIKASSIGEITTEDYHGDLIADSGYNGIVSGIFPQDTIDQLYKGFSIDAKSVEKSIPDFEHKPTNIGVIIHSDNSSSSGLGRKNSFGDLEIIPNDIKAFGLRGRSAEQRIALAHLLDPKIGIVSLGGSAGTGKSVLAIAAALELVMERNQAKKVIVFRPVLAVGGEEIGFLPGTATEKMAPFAAATRDALSSITSETVINEILERGLLEVLPLTYIRGRSFVDTILIIDEAQNLERNTLLTALSRTGRDSRVFMTHDVAQRDNLHVGRYDGVAAVVEKLKGEDLFAHITLTRSERSPVAEMVTRLLDLE